MDLKRYLSEAELALTQPSVGDEFDISINEVLNLETEVLESTEDGITLAMDDRGMAILEELSVLEDYEDPHDANEIGYIKTGARKGSKERDKWERWHRDAVKRAVTGMTGRKEGEKIEEEHDKSHGSPYDRGSADAYYGRSRRPHKLAPKAGGVQGEMELVPLTDPAEIAAYNAGYSETDDRKDWGESIATEGAEVSYKVSVVDPETYDKQTLEISAVTSSEAKEKAEGKGYKVLKVTDTIEANESENDQQAYDSRNMPHADRMKAIGSELWFLVQNAHKTGKYDNERIEREINHWEAEAKKLGFESVDDIDDYPYWDQYWLHVPTKKMYVLKKAELQQDPQYRMVTNSVDESLRDILRLSGLAETSEKMLAKMAGNDLYAARRAAKAAHQADMEKLRAEKEKESKVDEAEYQGRQVKLGKPMAGDVKKYKVYVRAPNGNIKKVNFGDKNMEIKRDNPARRKNFRARHNCADKKDRTKAGYWSCRMWSKKPVSKIV